MTDRADEIIDAIAKTCEGFGHPVEVDRVHEIDGKDCPLVVVRTGDEEVVDFDGRDPTSWDRIWKMEPTVEIYLQERDSSKQRSVISSAWSQFLEAFDGSPAFEMMAHGYAPEIRREIVRPDDKSIVGLAIDLGIFFER